MTASLCASLIFTHDNIHTVCVLMVNYFWLVFFSSLFWCYAQTRKSNHLQRFSSHAVRKEKERERERENRLVIFSSHFKLQRLRILPLDQISFLMCSEHHIKSSLTHICMLQLLFLLCHPAFTFSSDFIILYFIYDTT